MRKNLTVLLTLFVGQLIAQSNTEVYLFDIESEYGGLVVYNKINISNDDGYDSQPFFLDNDHVLFAGNNNGQTDIAKFSIANQQKTWFNTSTEGGEYSPVLIPNTSSKVAAVRLDPDGLQRLYSYETDSESSTLLVDDLQVAYYTLPNQNTLVASVLSGDSLDLVIHDFATNKTDTILTGSGRSIHNIPGSKSVSYAALNEEKNQDIYLLQLSDRESFFICQLPIGIQDYIWLNDSQLLIGSGSKLYIFDTFLNSDWKEIADLSEFNINNITRLAVSPNSKKLAIVAEPK